MARIGSASAKSPSLLTHASVSHPRPSGLGFTQRHQRCTPTGLHLLRLALLGFLRNVDSTVKSTGGSRKLHTAHAAGPQCGPCRPSTRYTVHTGHYWTLRSFTSDSRRSAASSRSRSVRPDSWRVRRLRSLSLSSSCPACASRPAPPTCAARWPRACTARRGPCGTEARRGSTRACGGCRGGVEARVRRYRCKAGACGDRAGGPQCLAAQASVRGHVCGAYLVLKVVLRHLLSVGWMSIMKLLSDSARRTAQSPRMSRST